MPDKENPYHPLHDLPNILFLLGQMTMAGTYIIFFLLTYLTFDEQRFASRYETFKQSMHILWPFAIILLTGYFILSRQGGRAKVVLDPGPGERRKLILKIFALFLAFLSLALLWQFFTGPFHLLHLLLFFLLFIFLWFFTRAYEMSSTRPAWNHPTSSGGMMQGSLAIGLGCSLFIFDEPSVGIIISRWLLLLLIIRILTLWSRFRFLSRNSPHTRLTLKIILGSHLVLFSIRFIFGLIMPLVYLLWRMTLSPALPIQPVALMVMVGEASEAILFFISSPPLAAESMAPPTD